MIEEINFARGDDKDLPLSQVQANFVDLVHEVANKTKYLYILAEDGSRLAALVPAKAAEFLEQTEDDYSAQQAEETMKRAATGGEKLISREELHSKQLRPDLLGELIEMFEAEHGPISKELLAEAEPP